MNRHIFRSGTKEARVGESYEIHAESGAVTLRDISSEKEYHGAFYRVPYGSVLQIGGRTFVYSRPEVADNVLMDESGVKTSLSDKTGQVALVKQAPSLVNAIRNWVDEVLDREARVERARFV